MRITRRGIQAAMAAAVLAVVVAGCGGDDDGGSSGGGVIDQVIAYNWGTEPPSLDPGLATDST